MTSTWKIQTQIFPLIFNNRRGEFVENILIDKSGFICNLYNDLFHDEYIDGNLKERIQYSRDEFDVTIVYDDNDKRMIFIEVPEPRSSDFSYSLFTKYYCIPYRVKENGIEVYELYGVETIKGTKNNLLVFYKDAQHLISNLSAPCKIDDKDKFKNFMYEYVFRYDDK